MGRERRKSSLGVDIRAGDTSTPAVPTMATTKDQPQRGAGLPTRSMNSSADGIFQQRVASKHRRRKLSRRRPEETGNFFIWYRELSYRKTWLNPLLVMLIAIGGYAFNPTPSNPFHACIFLSYPLPPDPTSHAPTLPHYAKGRLDFVFVLFYTFLFSFTREFLMQELLRPVALHYNFTKKSKVSRFMEQSYTAIYFFIFGPFGLYVMSHTPIWYFNSTAYYELYPHRTHTADFKAYYLLQAAYWLQQCVVLLLQLEKPRKDFKELVMHHIVTLTLVGMSYRYHFTWIGLAVFVTHDISDFFLATSKTLNYLDHPLIGPYFGFFIGVWIYMRHYLNLGILWSVLTEFRSVGSWELDWNGETYKSGLSQGVAIVLLGSLQAVNLFWLWLILRIAKRFVLTRGAEAVDERSDESDSESESEWSEGSEDKKDL